MPDSYQWKVEGGWGGWKRYTRPGYEHYIVRRVDNDPNRFELVNEKNGTTSRLMFGDLYSALDEAKDIIETEVTR